MLQAGFAIPGDALGIDGGTNSAALNRKTYD